VVGCCVFGYGVCGCVVYVLLIMLMCCCVGCEFFVVGFVFDLGFFGYGIWVWVVGGWCGVGDGCWCMWCVVLGGLL
jgi:hypothetical protein